jgi:hypothetical protein
MLTTIYDFFAQTAIAKPTPIVGKTKNPKSYLPSSPVPHAMALKPENPNSAEPV